MFFSLWQNAIFTNEKKTNLKCSVNANCLAAIALLIKQENPLPFLYMLCRKGRKEMKKKIYYSLSLFFVSIDLAVRFQMGTTLVFSRV